MGRKKKYQNGSTLITLNMDNDVLDVIDIKAKQVGKNRSEFMTDICKFVAMKDNEFCTMKAKQAAQDLFYWKSKAEALQECEKLSK